MRLTIQLKLLPTLEQADLLKRTLERANAACDSISQVAWDARTFGQFPLPLGTRYVTLGLALDADSNIFACDMGHQAIKRITPDNAITTYSAGAPGHPMRTPNYPVFDQLGNLYVSDSGGFHEHNGCLFRVRPGGATEVISEDLCQFPNGMALSPTAMRSTW